MLASLLIVWQANVKEEVRMQWEQICDAGLLSSIAIRPHDLWSANKQRDFRQAYTSDQSARVIDK